MMMFVRFAVLQGQWIIVFGLLGVLLAEALHRLVRAWYASQGAAPAIKLRCTFGIGSA